MKLEQIENNWAIAAAGLSKKITSYDDKLWGCPWMRYWNRLHPNEKPKHGIFVMQDWGSQTETLKDATLCVEKWFQHPTFLGADKTIHNLLRNGEWISAFIKGDWLITNAVWGLRTDNNKCGYLGDRIHREAYKTIWRPLVLDAVKDNNPIQLVVAGEWARFKDDQSNMDLSNYLAKWDTFAKIPPTISPVTIPGKVIFCAHPCTWHWRNFSGGPPLP